MRTISIYSTNEAETQTRANRHGGAPRLGMAAVVTAAPAVAQETKPNIVFIMGDDIGWMQPSIYHRRLGGR